MNVTRNATTISICALTFFLHMIGGYLLWQTYNWRNVTTQQLLIFNVCACECLCNFIWIFIYSFEAQGYSYNTKFYGYSFLIYQAFKNVLYMLMMFMTLDRLLAAVLSLKYPQYWTVEKTRKTLCVIWSIGFSMTVIFRYLQ